MSSLQVFVYGTLKPGYQNHERYCRDRLLAIQPAKVRGCLYSFRAGYPGMARGQQWVQGYLLTLSANQGNTLRELDALEEYDPENSNSLYQREQIAIFSPAGVPLGQAWVYVMAIATIQAMQGTPVPSGNWTSGSHCSEFQ